MCLNAIELGTVPDWVGAIAVLGVLGAAIWAGRVARKTLHLHTFSALLREISSEEASSDRGTVREYIKPEYEVGDIKRLVLEVREGKSSKAGGVGAAAERTIARLDRVGFFLIGNDDKLKMEPPVWLWTITSEMWVRLGKWVEYRQTNKDDRDFWHEGYGLYFQKLAEEARKKRPEG